MIIAGAFRDMVLSYFWLVVRIKIASLVAYLSLGQGFYCILFFFTFSLPLGEYVLKRVSLGSKHFTKEQIPECAYFLGQTS